MIRLKERLAAHKSNILKKWFDLIVDTYPYDSSKYLKNVKNRFGNPVGSTISMEIEKLYDELLGDMDSGKIFTSLDSIIKIRSVQEFTASEAVAFVFMLKSAALEQLRGDLKEEGMLADWLAFESRIDKLALQAFDSYADSRERIFDIRVREIRRKAELVMMDRINMPRRAKE